MSIGNPDAILEKLQRFSERSEVLRLHAQAHAKAILRGLNAPEVDWPRFHDIIEDVIPLYKLQVSVRVSEQVRSVACVPEQEPLCFEQSGGRVEFVVRRIEGHQMIAISFG